MLLSIITINFNNRGGLDRTFSSVFTQSYQGFEYIVIDGGSNDGSKDSIDSFGSKISHWVSEKDNGIYHAINKGINFASGEYILCLNSGDTLYDSDVLRKILPYLERGKDLIYGNAFCLNHHHHPDTIWHLPKKLDFNYFTEGALCHQATFIRKDLFGRVGKYDESLKISSDWFFTLKALAYFNATYEHVDLLICSYDKSGISATQLDLVNIERLKILKQYFGFFAQKSIIYQDNSSSMFSRFLALPKKILKNLLPYGFVCFIQNKRKKVEFIE